MQSVVSDAKQRAASRSRAYHSAHTRHIHDTHQCTTPCARVTCVVRSRGVSVSSPRVSRRPLWHVAADFAFGCAFVSRGVPSLVLLTPCSLWFCNGTGCAAQRRTGTSATSTRFFLDGRQFGAGRGSGAR